MGELGQRPKYVPAARYALAALGQRLCRPKLVPAARHAPAALGLRLAHKKRGGRGPMQEAPNIGDECDKF